jgi:hypothetical protein
MDELGLDFAVLYPTFGLTEPPRIDEEEVRRASCRALNAFIWIFTVRMPTA